MGKVFCAIGVATTISVAFVGGMVATMLAYGKNPELGHKHIDAIHEAYEGLNKKEA